MDSYWIANIAVVAAEDFDGETVVINFETGRYFSLGGAATWIWRSLERGASVGDVAAQAPPEARPAIARAFETLAAEGLTIPAAQAPAAVADKAPEPWSAPRIEVFSDLAELVALDPVHEVNAMMGWPHRANP